MQQIKVPSEPPSMRYVFATQPWWMNVILWAGRLALAGAILVMLVPIGFTLCYIFEACPTLDKPTWASGDNPIWIAMWCLQAMIWSFLAVTLYRGLRGLPVVFKNRYVDAFSFEAAAIWSLLPLGLFLLPLQLEIANWLALPQWLKDIYASAGWIVKYVSWTV